MGRGGGEEEREELVGNKGEREQGKIYSIQENAI